MRNGKLKQLIKDLKVFYDIIIFDTVSILEAPEASILANASDLVLMMSSYGNTKIEEFTKAYEKIKDIQDVMVGMGLNKIPDRKLKKKLANVKIRWKHWTHKALGKMSVYWKKLKQLLKNFRKVGVVFAFVGSMLVAGAMLLRKCLVSCGNKLKLKSQDVKEYIKNYKAKREKIKLIESGSMIVEPEEKMPKVLEKEDVVQEEEVIEDLEVKPAFVSIEKQTKSKFDLIREQQEKNGAEKGILEKAKEENFHETKIEQTEIQKVHQELQEKQKMEREKREAEKRLQREQIKNFKDIDFQAEENITEEMIRRQVEMDDMIRMAEAERQEEKMNLKKQKLLRKNEKKKEREAKKELKAKMKEEKKASRERVKQIYIEEARIDAQLKEDNLYPRIRM